MMLLVAPSPLGWQAWDAWRRFVPLHCERREAKLARVASTQERLAHGRLARAFAEWASHARRCHNKRLAKEEVVLAIDTPLSRGLLRRTWFCAVVQRQALQHWREVTMYKVLLALRSNVRAARLARVCHWPYESALQWDGMHGTGVHCV